MLERAVLGENLSGAGRCWWDAGGILEDIRKIIDIGEGSVTHREKITELFSCYV